MKKQALLVFFITFLIYSPLLFNGFVGDDNIILTRNTFYSSWSNVPRLVERGYISNSRDISFNRQSQTDFGTGSVSYRPVSNFIYFFDYHLFHAKPWGSHLINIIIHAFNAVLVYTIVDLIFASGPFSIFAALLFSLHPMQSEAVAVMSYRADICAAMFALLSFYCWIKGYYRRSLLAYFLAIFSKESASVLPFVILLFDYISGNWVYIKRRIGYYLGFVGILLGYIYLYVVVFPNSSIPLHWLGDSFTNHILIMGSIWLTFLINAIAPWTVKVIPSLYCPPVPNILMIGEIVVVLAVFMATIVFACRRYPKIFFFLSWYLIFYMPVSNLIPIANPMASRFMYLPSVGLLIAFAFLLYHSFNSDLIKRISPSLSMLLAVAVMLILVTKTLFLNGDWKSNFDAGWAWMSDYPQDGRGYALIGTTYFAAGHPKEARGYLEKSLSLGNHLPYDEFTLAQVYLQLGQPQEAKDLLGQIVLFYPDFTAARDLLSSIKNV